MYRHQCGFDRYKQKRTVTIEDDEPGNWNLTCPKSIVIVTRWYWRPRDRGGDCHHFSVPSIANAIEWFLEDTVGSQWSQDSPRISNFPATVANLQNNSGSPMSSPHVAVASIFFPWAMLIAGGLSLCPYADFVAILTTRRTCRMAKSDFFIVECPASLHTSIPRAENNRTQTSLRVETAWSSNYLGRGVRRIPGFPAISEPTENK